MDMCVCVYVYYDTKYNDIIDAYVNNIFEKLLYIKDDIMEKSWEKKKENERTSYIVIFSHTFRAMYSLIHEEVSHII